MTTNSLLTAPCAPAQIQLHRLLRREAIQLDDRPPLPDARDGSMSNVYLPLMPSFTGLPGRGDVSFPFFRSMATIFHACPRRW